ncbi:MAG: beta strand repeat-containing protein [Planctomycetota bacterium]
MAENKVLQASGNVVLKDAFGSGGDEEPPAGEMDLFGHGWLGIRAEGGSIQTQGPFGEGVKITVEDVSSSSLHMRQADPLNLADYSFGNQNNTALYLNSINGSITAVDSSQPLSGKNENAADQWTSITAQAYTDITLQGHDASRDITTGVLTSYATDPYTGDISVTSDNRKVLATGEINANNGSVTLTAINPDNGGIELHANVTSGDFQDYIGDVELKDDVTATSTGGSDITFTGTVDGTHALTVNTAGVTKFQDEVGGMAPLASLTTDAPGHTEIWADIYLNGASATFNDAVLLKNDLTINEAGTGNIEFASTVDSEVGHNYWLTVNSSSGATIFGGAVGSGSLAGSESTGLGRVTTNSAGTTQINGGSVTTNGNQYYYDPVTLGDNTTLNGKYVTFAKTLDSDSGNKRSLLVNASDVTTFNGVVGGIDRLSHLETDAAGRTEISAGTINLDGDSAKFADPVLLTDDLTINEAGSGNIEFVSTVDSKEGSNYSLTVNSGAGATIFASAVGSDALGVLSDDEGLGSLTTNAAGTTQINGGSVTTTWDQKYHDAVTLGTDTTLNAGHNVETSSTLYGNGSLIALADNNIKLEGPTETVGNMKLDAGNSIKTSRSLISGGKLNADADWNIELGGHTQSTDIMKLIAGNNITADKSLTSGFKLVADAGNNIYFGGHAESVDNMNLYAGKDIKTEKSVTSTAGKLNASADHNIEFGGEFGGHAYSADTMNLYAGNNIKAAKSVKTGGKLNAEAGWDIRIDGDVESTDNMNLDAYNKIEIGNKITSGGKLTALAGNKIIFNRWAQSEGDMLLDADNDVYAYGDLTSNNGSIDIYSSDYTTYLGGDVTAAVDVTLHNNTKFDGGGYPDQVDQTVEAGGTITAHGWLKKVTSGDLTLIGGSDGTVIDDAIDLDELVSTHQGNLWIIAESGDIQLGGDVTTFGEGGCDRGIPCTGWSTGGVLIYSKDGKIYTRDEVDNDTLNVSITGNSDHWEGLGIYDPRIEEGARVAIAIWSEEDLKIGTGTEGAELRAFGRYYDDVDDRAAIDFLADPLTSIGGIVRDEGDPFDAAIYVGSNGDVDVSSPVSIISREPVDYPDYVEYQYENGEYECVPKGAMVIDAWNAVTFDGGVPGGMFETSLAYGEVGDRLEVVSRTSEWLFEAVGRLPYVYGGGPFPSDYSYVLRGAGLNNPEISDGRAWVLEDPVDPAPLYGEAGEAVDKEGFGEGGCPALMDWLAVEIGVPAEDIQVALAGALALNTDVQPCEMCARLMGASKTLEDADGTQIAAMARVVNEFVTTPAPPSPEQMTQIAAALALHVGDGTYYASAGKWIDALVAYVGIMNSEMGYSASDSAAFAQKYLTPVTETGNVALAAYVQARLAALGG